MCAHVILNSVFRKRLTDRLSTPIALITAPAGCGKTVLADQWAEDATHPVIRITFTQATSDIGAILAALQGEDEFVQVRSDSGTETGTQPSLNTIITAMEALADEFFVAERTVKKHLLNAYRKLGALNRTAAATHARALGLIA